MLYFSRGSFGSGFDVAVCPDAVAIDASEASKIEIRLGDIVENFMNVKWFERWSGQARRDSDFRFVIPNRRAGGLPYPRIAILSRILLSVSSGSLRNWQPRGIARHLNNRVLLP